MNSEKSVQKQRVNHIAPEGHPVHTLMEEHRFVLDFAARLVNVSTELKNKTGRDQCGEIFQTIGFLVDHLKSAQSHYLREENVLFAYLEKHGIAGPPRAMWTEHDQIRGLEKEIFRLYEEHEHMDLQIFAAELSNKAAALEDRMSGRPFCAQGPGSAVVAGPGPGPRVRHPAFGPPLDLPERAGP